MTYKHDYKASALDWIKSKERNLRDCNRGREYTEADYIELCHYKEIMRCLTLASRIESGELAILDLGQSSGLSTGGYNPAPKTGENEALQQKESA